MNGAADKKFIKSTFVITKKKDAKTETGVQVIGIDPANDRFALAVLLRTAASRIDLDLGRRSLGDRFVGDIGRRRPNRCDESVEPVGDDAFTWRSVQRSVGGEAQPDVPPVTVKRVAATSAPAPKK